MKNSGNVPLTEAEQRKGMRLIYFGQGVGPIITQLLGNSAFGVLLIKHLGGSNLQAMLLVSLSSLPGLLQIPISLIIPPSRGRRFMLRCWIGKGLSIFVAIGVIFLPIETRMKVLLVLLLFAIGAIIEMSGNTFWFPLLHDVVPEAMRGRFFGKLRTIWQFNSFLAIILAGVFLGNDPKLWRFQIVLAAALILYFLRNIFIARLPKTRIFSDQDYANWKHYLREILSRKQVLIFCGYFSLLVFTAGFLSTPLVLYMEHMGFQVRENVIIFGFLTLGSILSLLLAGVLTDRIGTKRVFFLAHVVLCLVCISVIKIGFLPAGQVKYLMPIALTVSGAMGAMAGVACTTQLFHLVPDRGRAFFLSLTTILITVGGALSPILAGYILQTYMESWTLIFLGIPFDSFQVLLGAVAFAMVLLLVFLSFVEDVRSAPLAK